MEEASAAFVHGMQSASQLMQRQGQKAAALARRLASRRAGSVTVGAEAGEVQDVPEVGKPADVKPDTAGSTLGQKLGGSLRKLSHRMSVSTSATDTVSSDDEISQLVSRFYLAVEAVCRCASQDDLSVEGAVSSPSVVRLVRLDLCDALWALLSAGFRSRNMLRTQTPWMFLESRLLKSSATSLLVIGLGRVVRTINENRLLRDDPEARLRALVCHCLNAGEFHSFLGTLAEDDDKTRTFYEPTAWMCRSIEVNATAEHCKCLAANKFSLRLDMGVVGSAERELLANRE